MVLQIQPTQLIQFRVILVDEKKKDIKWYTSRHSSTILDIMGIKQPKEMNGKSLLK